MDLYRKKAEELLTAVNSVILGKEEFTVQILAALLAGGHILLEDVPGVGKTTLAMAFSRAIGLEWRRVQFTPDIMPSDLTGFSVYRKEQEAFVYQPGAVFCNILLADEINRTSPKTQSALLEVMEEHQVTVDGKTRKVPRPFHVIATQNPLDTAGTQPLPEAQVDRFMVSLSLGYPDFEDEVRLIEGKGGKNRKIAPVMNGKTFLAMQKAVAEVYLHEEVGRYLVRLVSATRNHELLAVGGSPRASIDLAKMAKATAWLNGEDFVAPQDVRRLFVDVLKHRVFVSGAARHQRIQSREILEKIANTIPKPMHRKIGHRF